MKDLDPAMCPTGLSWLKEQHDATDPEANAGLSSEINEWHRKNQANYKKLVELWNKNPRDCDGMVILMQTSEDLGLVSGPARQEWLENRGQTDPGLSVTPEQ